MENIRLSIRNLDKSFSVPVLKHINLSIARGEIHALVGENGAGKSTLVNILAGNLKKDAGEVFLDGIDYDPSGPTDAFTAGMSCAAQELSIIGTLSVAENIALRDLPHNNFVITKARLDRQARGLLGRVGLQDVSPNLLAENLSLADRQLLELAKALSLDCRVLILDEPTAALTAPQAIRLHGIIAELAARGTSVIYISHRLNDVLSVSDTVSVLRDGQIVASAPANSLTVSDLMEQMTGRHYQDGENSPVSSDDHSPVLKIDSITTRELPHPISFECRKGEIVGIAGLAGSGRSELLAALFGLSSLTAGCVSRCTDDWNKSVSNASQAVRLGIGFLGEDRQSMGLFPGQSVLTNMMLPGASKASSPMSLIDRVQETAAASEMANKLAIKCEGLDQDIEQLSGGNQQKALIARWLHCDSDIFLLDEPTRGVDVGTKNAIYDLLFEIQGRGKTVLLASSEIEELMTVCTRILVLSDRKLVQTFWRDDWSEQDILAAAFSEFTNNAVAANLEMQGSRGSMSSN